MKTIIMKDPVMESEGSLFPKVDITAYEAEESAIKSHARLPTSEEYDRLFNKRPWPFLIHEWTSTSTGSERVIRGGSWLSLARFVRAAFRRAIDLDLAYGILGFRLARDIADDDPVPDGWIEI